MCVCLCVRVCVCVHVLPDTLPLPKSFVAKFALANTCQHFLSKWDRSANMAAMWPKPYILLKLNLDVCAPNSIHNTFATNICKFCFLRWPPWLNIGFSLNITVCGSSVKPYLHIRLAKHALANQRNTLALPRIQSSQNKTATKQKSHRLHRFRSSNSTEVIREGWKVARTTRKGRAHIPDISQWCLLAHWRTLGGISSPRSPLKNQSDQ